MSERRQLAEAIERGLRAAGTPERAVGAKRYLKSALEFLGVATPRFRVEVGAALRLYGPIDGPALRAVVADLWGRPVFELRAAAVELLDRHPRLLEPQDLATIERLLRESGTWALVDWLATRVAAPLVERQPELAGELDRWAADDDFWVRRAAMLALLTALRRGEGDFARFGRYADAMLEEREFFIRKAIGWVLREVGKRRPELVEAWLRPRTARASGLTVREAVKHLPADRGRTLLEARRGVARPGGPAGTQAAGGGGRRR
jgi:3-methyladenine DNA glycosylase AlkD